MPNDLIKKTELLQALTEPDFKQSAVIRRYGSLDMRRAMDAPTPCIGQLQKMYGNETMQRAVGRLLASSALWHDVELSQAKIEALYAAIMSKYELRSSLKLEDFVVIMSEIMEANCHKRLTINQMFVHIKAYSKRRIARAIEENINISQSLKDCSDLDDRIARGARFKDKVNALYAKVQVKNQRFLK
ncbi:MAG: hypothetical protein V6Z82_02510 [Flavobacteriales bacterium]